MKFDLPTKASQEVLEIDAREVEAVLQGPSMKLKPWPGAMVPLKDGRILYIREARLDEVPLMLSYLKRFLDVDHDFYDIVGACVLRGVGLVPQTPQGPLHPGGLD